MAQFSIILNSDNGQQGSSDVDGAPQAFTRQIPINSSGVAFSISSTDIEWDGTNNYIKLTNNSTSTREVIISGYVNQKGGALTQVNMEAVDIATATTVFFSTDGLENTLLELAVNSDGAYATGRFVTDDGNIFIDNFTVSRDGSLMNFHITYRYDSV